MKIRSKPAKFLFILPVLFISLSSLAGAAVNISRSSQWNSTSPRIAVDSKGNLHAIWVERFSNTTGDLFYSTSNKNAQQWSTPLNLSNSSGVYCDTLISCGIDVDGTDKIYVVWGEGNIVKLRIYSSGSWAAPGEIASSNSEVNGPKIAVSPEGNIYVIWWSYDGSVWSRARVNGVWEVVRGLSGGGRSKFPDIAVGYEEVFGCWVEKRGDRYQAVYTKRSRNFNASWSSTGDICPMDLSHQHPVIEIDSTDTAHVVWTSVTDGARIVHYSFWTGSGFASAEEISSTQVLHYPSLCERNNYLYACWQVGSYGAGAAIYYNKYQNGRWTGEAGIPESGGSTFSDVAANPDGNIIYFVWDGSGEIYLYSLGAQPGPGPNKLPVADFTFSPTTGEYPLEVTCDASLSYDPDGRIVRYEWLFGDGGYTSGKVVKHTFRTEGTFFIRLIVVDDRGGVGTAVKSIEILKPNVPPIAEFVFSPTTGIFPLEVTFDASASYDPDGEIVRYDWYFGDGVWGSGKVIKHTYAKWGTYNIKLTVVDNRNGVASREKPIEVLRLFQPLNMRWETFVDESLFLSRFITEVYWDKNPKNDPIAEIVLYRVYRKKTNEDYRFYKKIGEVKGDLFNYRDKDVKERNAYIYTITALDRYGHESPIEEGISGQAAFGQNLKDTQRKKRDSPR